MAKKKAAGGSNIPEWLVTFADLMSILVAFFVLLISFSVQDDEKLQVVAGSVREAFGIRDESRKAGMIEIEGAPVRDFARQVEVEPRPEDTDYADERNDDARQQGPEANTHDFELSDVTEMRQFASTAASLRQAWDEMPEIADATDQILMEETPEGLNIQLLDQEGRSMFEPGQAYLRARTRRILEGMAPILRGLPNRIEIAGHTDSSRLYDRPGFTQWELSAARANAARAVLAENGLSHDRFFSVVGKADTEPLFPDNTTLAANRRISILIMAEAPPIALTHSP